MATQVFDGASEAEIKELLDIGRHCLTQWSEPPCLMAVPVMPLIAR